MCGLSLSIGNQDSVDLRDDTGFAQYGMFAPELTIQQDRIRSAEYRLLSVSSTV